MERSTKKRKTEATPEHDGSPAKRFAGIPLVDVDSVLTLADSVLGSRSEKVRQDWELRMMQLIDAFGDKVLANGLNSCEYVWPGKPLLKSKLFFAALDILYGSEYEKRNQDLLTVVNADSCGESARQNDEMFEAWKTAFLRELVPCNEMSKSAVVKELEEHYLSEARQFYRQILPVL